jgi:hypothetical protein
LSFTYRRLCVTILSTHGEVEPEGVAVDDVHVAGLRPAEGVDAAAERPVGVHVDHDAGVLTVDGHYINKRTVSEKIFLVDTSVPGKGTDL